MPIRPPWRAGRVLFRTRTVRITTRLSLRLNLPNLQVTDSAISGNSLAVAIYGRGIWVLDDTTLLRNGWQTDSNELFEVYPVSTNYRLLSRATQNYARRKLSRLNGATVFYQLKEGESHVGNVAAYRLHSEFDENHLSEACFSYRENDPRWQVWERQALVDFQKTGEKYDTVGIQPDIVIEAQIPDWLEQSDTVPDRATTLAKESILGSTLEMQ